MLTAVIILACLSLSATCGVVSLVIYKWDMRQEHRYKIELMNSSNHSWEEFDMVNKNKFESEYWRGAENGKNTART